MSWDEYFLDLCNTVSRNSKCFSRKIGCVIVKDKSILSTGYNGPPRGIPHCNQRYYKDKKLIEELKNRNIEVKDTFQCPRRVLGYKSGEGLEWCVATHAEVNAIVNAARMGVSIKDSTLYLNIFIPCSKCLMTIINAGIKEVVVTDLRLYDEASIFLLKNSELKIRKYQI